MFARLAPLCRPTSTIVTRVGGNGVSGASLAARWLHASVGALGVVAFKLSDIGEGIAEVQIKEWHVKVGDHVSQFDELCEVQSDKASVTITSRYDGVITKLHASVDDMARVGQPLVDIEVQGEGDEAPPESTAAATPTSPQSSGATAPPPASTQSAASKPLATPAVRRIAMENNVTLSDVRGTGNNGRVLKEDILRHIGAISADTVPMSTASVRDSPSTAATPLTQRFVPLAADEVIPIRGYTRAMMKTMTEANKIPHFGYNDEVIVNRLVDLREQLKQMAGERGVRMSYMPLFVKAASLALQQYPVLNSQLDSTQDNIIYKAAHNICVAIDTPGGLVVPNIKHCEQRNLWEIASELNRLQEAARRQQLAPDDLRDGTFTLSNIGTIGGTYAHPVIFPPQVAIGALGKISVEPRYKHNDSTQPIYPARLVRVSWCADHRVIDGATMARFSNLWKEYLEHPALMIAQMR